MDEQRKWEEGTDPTPAQWTRWFLSLSDERQLQVAQQVIVGMQAAIKCVQSDHIGELTWHALQRQWGKWLLAEADWEHAYWATEITGNDPKELWERIQHNRNENDHD